MDTTRVTCSLSDWEYPAARVKPACGDAYSALSASGRERSPGQSSSGVGLHRVHGDLGADSTAARSLKKWTDPGGSLQCNIADRHSRGQQYAKRPGGVFFPSGGV